MSPIILRLFQKSPCGKILGYKQAVRILDHHLTRQLRYQNNN